MAVVATVTITFIIIGDINTLAPIVTMPFLLTYACIDYSYFALAQTFDIQNRREERYRIQAQSPSYQATAAARTTAAAVDQDNDLDHLFPDRTRHKDLHSGGNNQTTTSAAVIVPTTSATASNTTENETTTADDDATTAVHPDGVTFRGVNSTNAENPSAMAGDDEEPMAPSIRPPIHSKTKNWYSAYCNRWASLIGVRNVVDNNV